MFNNQSNITRHAKKWKNMIHNWEHSIETDSKVKEKMDEQNILIQGSKMVSA